MPITVEMIEEKEFKTKVRGYDPAEVDEPKHRQPDR